jgi:hypothetical protein
MMAPAPSCGERARTTSVNSQGGYVQKPFLASMSGKVINQLMYNLATKARFLTLES